MGSRLNRKYFLYCAVFALAASTFLEFYSTAVEMVRSSWDSSAGILTLCSTFLGSLHIKRWLLCFLVLLIIAILIKIQKLPPIEFLYRHRFLLGGLLLFTAVLFEINGSSIGCWHLYLNGNVQTIYGVPRPIRTDELVVNTPFAISQAYNNYAYFSPIVRGCTTDMFIVYGQPVWDIAEIYRPFHWGYLLLGSARGLSFFWCARLITLFLVTFQFLLLLTGKNRRLSFIGAMLVMFAPIVQWWFAINGLVEMLVFGQLALLMVYAYMRSDRFWNRCLYVFVLVICAGGYLLTFYPAWQIPLAYVFLGLLIWVIAENRRGFHFTWRDLIPLAAAAMLFGGTMLHVYHNSADTIAAVMNTAYPGARISTGGDVPWERYFIYPINLLYTVFDSGMPGNVCEQAVFYDLFPVPLILSVVVLITNKKKDLLLIILLILSVFFAVWCTIGFPVLLAKLTLMSLSPGVRSFLAAGFVNVLLLIRALSLWEKSLTKFGAATLSLAIAAATTVICWRYFPGYGGMLLNAAAGSCLAVCLYLVLRYRKKICMRLFTVLIVLVMFVCGGLVNPVQQGLGGVEDISLVQTIRQIDETESGIWIVEGCSYPFTNLPLLVGASDVNSTSVYPNLERWEAIDPSGEYRDVYNRYAHISVFLGGAVEKFVLVNPDSFIVYVTVREIADMGVRYILSPNELEAYSSGDIAVQEIAYDGKTGFHIYELHY